MAGLQNGPSDEQVDRALGNLLRVGVLTSAAIVAAGGIVYLIRHGAEPADHHTFHGEPAELRNPLLILHEAASGGGRGLIALGLLVLIATPVTRVAFSVYAFSRQRDAVYVAVTLFVLAVLLWSLFSGYP